MITNELLEYIKGEHLRGVSLESIKVILLENGWLTADIEEAFNSLYAPAQAPRFTPPAVVQQPAPVVDAKSIVETKIEPVFEKPIAMETKPDQARIQSILDRELQSSPTTTINEKPLAEVKPIAEIKPEPVMETKPMAEVRPEPVIETMPIAEIKPEPIVQKVEEVMFKPEPVVEKKPEPIMETKPVVGAKPEPTIKPVDNSNTIPNSLNIKNDTQVLGISDSLDYLKIAGKSAMKDNIINPYLMGQEPKPKSKVKKILFIIFLIIVAACSALATYAYYNGYFVSLESISKNAATLASSAEGLTYDITASVDMSGVNKDALTGILPENIFSSNNASVTFRGSYDKFDPNNLKLTNALNLNFGAINGAVETRLLDGTFYAEITKMPTIAFLGDMSPLTNKWVSFPTKNGSDTLSKLPISSVVGIDPSVFSNLSEEQKNKFYQMTKDASFIKITKKLPMETITNGPAYHFYFELDNVGIQTYLQNVKDYVNTVGKDNSVLTSFDPVSKYDTASKYLKSFQGEAWIGKNDNLPQKVTVKIISLINPDKIENGEITFNFVAILKDWNKPLDIKAPADSMTFEELMNQFTGQAQIHAMDTGTKSYINNIIPAAEIFKGNNKDSFKGFCSSKEFKDMFTQANSMLNNNLKQTCLDSKTQYVVSAKLNDGTYYCVDSTGASKGVPSKPAGLICQ